MSSQKEQNSNPLSRDELVRRIMRDWAALEDFLSQEEEEKGRPLTDEELLLYSVVMRFGKNVGNQWIVSLNPDAYSVSNPRLTDGVRQFYEMESGKYKNPIYTIEPDLAFEIPQNLSYVNADGEEVVPSEKIGGIICQEDDGSPVVRTSLSNKKAPEYKKTADGIQIGNEKWYLYALVLKDKNRAFNYDAIYRRTRPEKVKVVELADFKI